ncbi:MAG: hypothetical protein CL869_00930 [Cytophagia bacterium]|nr:hypothetical protein [Cytophagia bacterium]|tara:strand:- start:2939 stop:4186 length:1248 start_codon:yes stop_codon:yes gene_type:complete
MIYKTLNKLNKIKTFPYYFLTPLVYAIGNKCEQLIVFSLLAKLNNKKLIILQPNILKKFLKYHIANQSLPKDLIINGEKQNKNNISIIILNYIFNLEFILRRFFTVYINRFFKIKLSETFRFPYIGAVHSNYEKILKSKFEDLDIKLSNDKKIYCENILRKAGIDDNEKIICLHVRDGAYRKDESRKSYRNSNINNYTELVKYLINEKYTVFRMGSKNSENSNHKDKRFINYPTTDLRSDLMDVYLISRCDFFIATQSGLLETAYMFNKPMLITNMVELYCSYPRKKNDRGIFKKIIDKKIQKEISISDYAKMPYGYHDPWNEQHDLSFVENTPEEIYNSGKEFVDLIRNKNFELNQSQKNLNNFLKKRMKEMEERKELEGKDFFEYTQLKRLHMWNMKSEGSLTKSYLKNIKIN